MNIPMLTIFRIRLRDYHIISHEIDHGLDRPNLDKIFRLLLKKDGSNIVLQDTNQVVKEPRNRSSVSEVLKV